MLRISGWSITSRATDRVSESFLTEPDGVHMSAELLPHELVHSWNGKFRRPAGLATPDYQQPMRGELLWVMRASRMYLGPKILAVARSGLETNADFRSGLAQDGAMLAHRTGTGVASARRHHRRRATALCVARSACTPPARRGFLSRRRADLARSRHRHPSADAWPKIAR